MPLFLYFSILNDFFKVFLTICIFLYFEKKSFTSVVCHQLLLKYVLYHSRFEHDAVCQKSDQFWVSSCIIFKRGSIECLYHYCYLEYLFAPVCSVFLLPLYGNTTFSGSISNVSSATMWLVQVLDRAHWSWTHELQCSKSAVEQLCIGSRMCVCVRGVSLVYWDPGWNVLHDVRRHNTHWWWRWIFFWDL